MQYVRSISGSVSKTWNSINPATLSGAIDVIVVEHDDGTLGCSPFHVRFGKFSLLRPYEKKVEFRVNDARQDYSMKLGEGGEAFFVFETTEHVPAALQTSPLVSPATSPTNRPSSSSSDPLTQEPEPLELDPSSPSSELATNDGRIHVAPMFIPERREHTNPDSVPVSKSLTDEQDVAPLQAAWAPNRNTISTFTSSRDQVSEPPRSVPSADLGGDSPPQLHSSLERSASPPRLPRNEAVTRAMNLSKKLWGSNIPSHINEEGDLMLDMTGYKTSDEEGLRAEVIARQILSEELEGNYDIGSLIGADDKGNLWIYSSEEAKETAAKKSSLTGLSARGMQSSDALSDPGYHSDDNQSQKSTIHTILPEGQEADSAVGLVTPPDSPSANADLEPIKNYAKTLRLSSDQLKTLNLRPGPNPMSFSVNKATCQANIYLWRHDVPIVISDIDGTITKSDALGHLLNMVGRDWTHPGVAKLYSDIVANGYNILYLTSRSVGQADTTRTYIYGINQEGNRLPKGPVIMSPDRTMAALRREVYLRKPEVFKMACLRDIMGLFNQRKSPFYAGFGNRLTDALSYRSVNIPSTRIFTINSNAEVSLDLLSLNSYRTAYTSMRETVDQFFPPVGMLVQEGGEDYTDFNYWRDKPLELDELSMSGSEDEDYLSDSESGTADDDLMSDELNESMYLSRDSLDRSVSNIRQSIETDEPRQSLDKISTQGTTASREDDEDRASLENSRASLESLDLVADAAGPMRRRNQPIRGQRENRSGGAMQRPKTMPR